MFIVAVLNQSQLLKGKDAEVSLMAQACSYQLLRHAGPAWGSNASLSVAFYSDARQVPEGACPIALRDVPDAPDALGYHTEDGGGRPVGQIFVQPIKDAGGTDLTGELSVSSVLSHEVLELWADPCCNRWADGPDGKSFSLELCDAVEDGSYGIAVKGHVVSVSNFLFPAWFDPTPQKGDRFDQLGKLKAPFTMTPGGYVVYRKGGTEHQLFGAQYLGWRKTLKEHATSRASRRMPRLPL